MSGSGPTMERREPGSENECSIIELRVEDVIRELPRRYRRGRGTKRELRATAIGIVTWSDFSNRFIKESDFTES